MGTIILNTSQSRNQLVRVVYTKGEQTLKQDASNTCIRSSSYRSVT